MWWEEGIGEKELDVVKEKHENIILITRDIKTPSILKNSGGEKVKTS